MIELSKKEIENLRICGSILNKSLDDAIAAIKPGISSLVIDTIAEKSLRKNGAAPSFLNFPSHSNNRFPNSICISINNEVVHGIPNKDKIIREGDIVGIDLGAEYKGVYTDMAKTIIIGKPKQKSDTMLVSVAKAALYEGIKRAIEGNTTGDIGFSIQKYVENKKFNVVRALVGHGIGKAPHTDPQIPNFGERGKGTKLVNNCAIAIEPMIVAGNYDVFTLGDGWTVSTRDGSNSAHFEHTILINNNFPEIITK
jgi:methionyl aminopeptidase